MSGNPLLVDPVSDPPCISVDERTAARLMGVSTKTLQRWRVSGELKFFRGPGNLGKVLHRLEDLKQFALDQVAMTEQREARAPKNAPHLPVIGPDGPLVHHVQT
jgi:hypothetical protein